MDVTKARDAASGTELNPAPDGVFALSVLFPSDTIVLAARA